MSALPLLQRRRERRENQQSTAQTRLTRSLLAVGLLFSFLCAAGFTLAGLGYAQLSAGLPSIETLPAALEELRIPTRLVDASGLHTLVELTQSPAARQAVQLENLPPYVVPLHLAALSPDYWQNPVPSLAQRLAVDIFLWQEPDTPRREIRARLLGGQILSRYGSEATLEAFLNSADYGHYATGLEAAAQTYFGKPAAALSPTEAALLALSAADPLQNPADKPQASLQRARALLQQTLANPTEETPILRPLTPLSAEAPAFSALALQELTRLPGGARLTRGGVVIFSTLQYELYQQARCALSISLQAACPPDSASAGETRLSAVLLNPRSGQVLVVIGEMDAAGESARLESHRPGTSLLPFLYLTGFSRGISPASLVWDLPPETADLTPEELSQYAGPMRARTALIHDRLAPAQRLLNELSLPALEQTLSAFGLPLNPQADLPAWLNAPQSRLSPLSLAQAYGILAAEGVKVQSPSPFLLRAQNLSGATLLEPGLASASPIISPSLVYLLNHILSAEGLETPARVTFAFPAALKAGQTPDGQDVWAAAYTSQTVSLVWSQGSEPQAAAQTAKRAAQLLNLAAPLAARPGWQTPAEITRLTVCDPSGMLPTPACPSLVEEVFLSGYEPAQPDTLYRLASVDRETGLLATVFTDPALVEERAFLLPPPEAQEWARARGLESLPDTYDTLQSPPALAGVQITFPQMFAEVKGKVTVRGLAAGQGFVSYRLEVGQGLYPSRWLLVTEGAAPAENESPLGTWDSSGLQGVYILRLTVVYANGEIKSAAVAVRPAQP